MESLNSKHKFEEKHFGHLKSSKSLEPSIKLSVEEKTQDLMISELGNLEKEIDSAAEELLPSLENCPMSAYDIKAHSVLDTLDIGETLKEFPKDKALKIAANFLGGGLITGKENEALEGFKFFENFKIWKSLVKDINKSIDGESIPQMENILKGIEQLESGSEMVETLLKSQKKNPEELEEAALNQAKKIKSLKPGESYSISGGWLDRIDGGHALIYEFIRDENNLLGVNLYTSTYHPDSKQYLSGNKQKLQFVVQYRGIPEEHLFFSEKEKIYPTFLQHLLEIHVCSTWLYSQNERQKVDLEDIVRVFSYLEPYKIDTPVHAYGLISGQRAGTCVPSVTKAWIRAKTEDLGHYKQLIAHAKFRLLISCYKALEKEVKENSPEGERARRTLKYLSRNFLRSVLKLTKGIDNQESLIDPGLAEKFQATAYDLLLKIEAAESGVQSQKNKDLSDAAPISDSKRIEKIHKGRAAERARNLKNSKVEPLSKQPIIWEMQIEKCEAAISTFQDFIKQSDAICKEYDGAVYDSNVKSEFKLLTCLKINNLIDQIPLLKTDRKYASFWANPELEQMNGCMQKLEALLDIYRKCNDKENISRIQTTALTVHALIHSLALQIEEAKKITGEASLKNYDLPEFLHVVKKLEGLLFYDSKEFIRIQEIASYFDSLKSSGLAAPFCIGSTGEGKRISVDDEKKFPYWNALLRGDNNLKESVAAEGNERWKDLTEEEIEQDFNKQLLNSKLYPDPVRKENLFPFVKNILVCESCPQSPRNVLQNCGYDYINILRRVSNHTEHLLRTGICDYSSFSFTVGRAADEKTASISLSQRYFTDEYEDAFSDYRPLEKLDRDRFNKRVFKRQACDHEILKKGEGEALKTNSKGLYQDLERLAADWKVAPYQLIYHLKRDLNSLKAPSFQMLFFQLFFRSPLEAEKMALGAGQMIVEEKALRENALDFIKSGLAHFERHLDKDGLDGVRFFLEFSFYLSNYLKDAGKCEEAAAFDFTSEINRWLNDDSLKLTQKKEAVLHQYRLLFSSLKDPENLDADAQAAAFQSWISYQFDPDAGGWRSPSLLNRQKGFIIRLIAALSKGEDKTGVGLKILKLLKQLPAEAKLTSTIKNNLISVAYPHKGTWTIDLLLGHVHTPSGKLGTIDSTVPWEQHQNFKRLFGSAPKFKYIPGGGDTYFFEDGNGGRFRVGRNAFENYRIQQQLTSDGPWYEYRENQLDGILSADHGYWHPIASDSTSAGYIIDIHTNAPRFIVDEKGVIKEIERFGNTAHEVDTLSGMDAKEGQEGFEKFTNILVYKEDGNIKKVSFPRFVSQEGTRLQFIKSKNDKLVWSQNQNYSFSEKMPRHLLAGLSNYLSLESKDSKLPDKILVPFKRIVDDKFEDDSPIPLSNNEGWGTVSFFSYDIINGEPRPTTFEARLFLAYLYLSQKKYAEAMSLLRKIQPADKLTNVGREILKLIYSYPLPEHHPDGKMVSLFAWLQNARKSDQEAKIKILTYPLPQEAALDYADSLNNISISCRLSASEESDMLEKIIRNFKEYYSNLPPLLKLNLKEANSLRDLKLKNRLKLLNGQKNNLTELERDIKKSASYESFYSNDVDFPNTTDWLMTGKIPKQLYVKSWIPRNGELFLHVYHIARSGSPAERKEMLYRLLAWSAKAKSKQDDLIELMADMLVQPDQYTCGEELHSVKLDHETKESKLEELYRCFRLNHRSQRQQALNAFIVVRGYQKDENQKGRFPILDKQLLYPNEPPKEKKKLFGPIATPSDEGRQKVLSGWKEAFLVPDKGEKEVSSLSQSTIFNREEQLEQGPIDIAVEAIRKDIEAAEEIRKSETGYTIANPMELFQKAAREKENNEKELVKIQNELLALANKRAEDPLSRQAEMAQIGGLAKNLLTVADCVKATLSLDVEEFKRMNPNLTEKEIHKIVELTLKVEELKSYKAQLNRISALSKQIDQVPAAAAKKYLTRLLVKELEAKYYFEEFDSSTQIILHVFCGETGMIPFKPQIEIIKQMLELHSKDSKRFKDIVAQLIMGGGKTSVIATIILYLATKNEGRLSTFIVPSSLFEVVRSNLGDSMLEAFKIQLQSIDVGREQLTTYKLEQIKTLMAKSIREGEPLITKATTIQSIDLEFKDQMLRRCSQLKNKKHLRSKDMIAETKKKIQLLNETDDIFRNGSDSLIDEVHVVMDCKQEVNFPTGTKESISKDINSIAYYVYRALTDSEIKIKDLPNQPSLPDIIELVKNEQSSLDLTVYKEKIVPLVAKYLLENCPQLKNVWNEGAFIRFASGQTPGLVKEIANRYDFICNEENLNAEYKDWKNYYKKIEDLQADAAFHRQQNINYASSDKALKNLANSIAGARQILLEITPVTLNKNGNRDYGLSKSGKVKIIPFKGVGVPAETEFKHYLIEACNYYQWAAAFPVSEEQVKIHLDNLQQSARYYTEKDGERFEETVEYKECLRLFGVKLDEIGKPDVIKCAAENISKNIKDKLDLAYEHINDSVSYYTESLTNNGMDLARLLSTKRTMSGTPKNVEGYLKSLSDRFQPDKGAVGKVLHALAEQKTRLHEVDFETVDEFVENTFKNSENPKRIRGINDVGGKFKKFRDNAEAARELSKSLIKQRNKGRVDENIEAVLFFDRDPGEKEPNTLYMWKLGAKKPERIGGTSPEQLLSKGLDPTKYFVFFDEKHAIGTDIKQLPDAVNLVTVDSKTEASPLCQAIMRLREYPESQGVEIVKNKEKDGSASSIEQIISNAIKREAESKMNDMVTYYKQQIDSLFRYMAAKKWKQAAVQLDSLSDEEFIQIVEKYKPFIVTKDIDEPFLQSGLTTMRDTKEMLTSYLNKKLDAFRAIENDSSAIKELDKEAADLEKHINSSKYLPAQIESLSEAVDKQQEVEVATETEMQAEAQTETEIQMENKIQLELESINRMSAEDLFSEEKMTEEKLLNIIKNKAGISLQEQLSGYKYNIQNEPRPFGKIFTQNISGTQEFFYTCNNLLPVFHKDQKPANQILAVKEGEEMRWVLLSEYQAETVKPILTDLYQKGSIKDVWFLQPDGTLFIDHPNNTPFPKEDAEVLKGLFELNVFEGNIDIIEKMHPETMEHWLAEDHTELKIQYLKCKTFNNPKQKEVLKRCRAVQSEEIKSAMEPGLHIVQARIDYERNKKGSLIPESAEAAQHCEPKDVGRLNVAFVKYLGMNKTVSEKIVKEQFKHIQNWQVPYLIPEQIKWLGDSKIKFLREKEQAQALSNNQAAKLVENQKNLLLYVNPDYFSNFTEKWQIQNVPVEHLEKINPKYLHFLTPQQIQHTPPQFLEALIKTQDPAILQHLSAQAFEKLVQIKEKFPLNWISESHIKEMKEEKTLKKLLSMGINEPAAIKKWISWLNPSMIIYLKPEHYRFLTSKDQIAKIPNDYICSLTPDQAPLITLGQEQFLETKELIDKCPIDLIPNLRPDQLKKMNSKTINTFTAHQMCNFFNRLKERKLDELIQKFTSAIDKGKIEEFSNDQILELSKLPSKSFETIRDNLTDGQINTFKSEELVGLLSRRQVKKLNWYMMEYLTEKNINWCAAENICYIPSRKIPLLKGEKIKYCKGEEQIKSLTEEQIPFIDKDQLENLTNEQLAFISNEMVMGVALERVKYLPPEKIPYIHTAQVGALRGKEQISACPDAMLHLLSDEQLSQIQEGALAVLRNEEVVNRLGLEQLKHLQEKSAIRVISFWKVHRLTPEQLAKRKSTQKVAHTLGIVSLGIMFSLVAAIAYISLIPLVALFNREAGRTLADRVTANPRRMKTYLPKLFK